MMNAFRVIVLVACFTQQVFAGLTKPVEPAKTVVYVATRTVLNNNQIYKFTQGREVQPGDWSQVRKDNAQPGDFSFLKAYSQAFPEDTYPDGLKLKRVGGFEKRMRVCRGHGYFQNRRSFILTEKSCQEHGEGWLDEFDFYVASEKRPGSVPYHYGVCQTKAGDVYGRVQRSSQHATIRACKIDDIPKEESIFYAFPGRLFCPLLDPPANGHQTSQQIGDNGVRSLTFGCSVGYQLLGSSSLTCEDDGSWVGQKPTCKAISCGRPQSPNNGYFEGDDFQYRQIVRYKCNEGYELSESSPKTRQCLETGSWSNNNAECERIECNAPNIQNGNIQGGSRFFFGDRISYVCFSGYTLKGISSATCTKAATFSERPPTCERIRCPTLSHPTNGYMTSSPKFVTDSEAIFVCHEGYRLQGEAVLKCEENGDVGVWSSSAPKCEEITCSQPVDPAHGSVMGTDFTYGNAVNYICDLGYQLNGTDRIVCQADGWDSQPPTCEAISCRVLPIPDHGKLEFTTRTYGGSARFSCDAGYNVIGKQALFCLETGEWNGHAPLCEPKKCPPLHPLDHGSRDSDILVYPNTIQFSCFPGYELIGSVNITCGSRGSWSHSEPTCRPCGIGYYKESLGSGKCTKCPDHSSTASTGSSNREHCQCDSGATRLETGDCEVISCEALSAPANGSADCSGTSFNDQCTFNCDAGYIRQGSHRRSCTAEGWSGNPATCTACPINTYKEYEGVNTCTPCPLNRYTNNQLGTSLQSCVCKPGYRMERSTCVDINECAVNNGNCDQRCDNVPGSHICSCTIPGYTLESDGTTCTLTETCEPLSDDKPQNGFLSCTHSDRENADTCHIKCNEGYFFVSGINNYVTCGSQNNFVWSHRVMNDTARIAPCTREFFVDVKLPVTLEFTSEGTCNDIEIQLTNQQLQSKIQEEVTGLNICRKACKVQDMRYQCNQGNTDGGVRLTVDFGVLLKNLEKNVSQDCDTPCKRLNMRNMLGETFRMKNSLEEKFKTRPTSIAYSESQPSLNSQDFRYHKPQILCDPGKVLTRNRLCAPCAAGYYLPNRELKTCLPCPVGSYQPLEAQTSCSQCLEGTTTVGEGSSHPVMCNVVVREIFRKK